MLRTVVTRCLVVALALTTLGLPFAYYRYQYTNEKRVRVVTEGKVYRCGQLSRAGIEDVVKRYGIRTIINLQDEAPDPRVGRDLYEAEYCRQLGVNYHWLPPQLVPDGEPVTIMRFLEICDDKNVYPILLHCKAGLHRTGTMVAFYRIEYEGWTPRAAMDELMTCGFSLKQCTVKNLYIKNYLVDYVPRSQRYAAKTPAAETPALP
jgi:tyrosine-protein phosphatase SIW14